MFGFCGLDVLLVYWAFRANFRAARAYEEVTVTASELTVRKVSHRGGVREWTLNPLWVRLERIVHEEFGIERLFLVSRGQRLTIAGFLGPAEKASFAHALSNALGEAKRGPTGRTVYELVPRPETGAGNMESVQKSGGLAAARGLHREQMMETPMLSPDRIHPMPLATAAADYDVVRKAIGHIRGHWREQPEIEAIAEAAGVTPTELHHLFRRWAGLTPKAFLQALTLDGARKLLRDSVSVLDATYEVGLSGPGRLHDLFVTHEAMSPGEWKSGGEGLTIHFGFHPSPFGSALVMATERGLAGLAFADPGKERAALADMKEPMAARDLRGRQRPHRHGRPAHFRPAAMAARSSRCAWC